MKERILRQVVQNVCLLDGEMNVDRVVLVVHSGLVTMMTEFVSVLTKEHISMESLASGQDLTLHIEMLDLSILPLCS